MSELVLPRADAPTRALAALRRAEARRLLAHLGRGGGGAAREVATRLGQIARTRPDDAVDFLCAPVPAMLLRMGRVADAAATYAFELALARRLGGPVDLGVAQVARTLLSPRHDACVTFAAGEAARLDDALRARRDGGTFVTIDGRVRLALLDANPLAHVEAHPDKHGNALSLGGRSVEEWRAALAAALALVARHLPGVHAEMQLAELLVIPVGHEPERHLSASYREYVGACYLTLHPRATTLAEALVHEFQHSKANLAGYHDALLENGAGELVRSPVRPDPRPLWGVLLAVHAFVPVAELYLRLRQQGDESDASRLADVIARNHEALATLAEHARPTPVGRRLLAELAEVHRGHAERVTHAGTDASQVWDGQ